VKEISTRRLLLRNYSGDERDGFIALFTDPTVMKHVDNGAMELSWAEKFWEKVVSGNTAPRQEIRAVVIPENGKYIGNVSIVESPYQPGELEIGFVLHKEFWGNGYATEIADSLIEYCFKTLCEKKVFATVDDDNYASINVLKKSGMKFLRYEFDDRGRFSIYSIAIDTE